MRIPLCWLKDYVTFDDTVAGLAAKLTAAGIEVEAIETVGSDFAGLVVAGVRAVAPHPNADRLSVCTVYDGANEVQVVCGAPNVREGGRYAFAPVGAALPGGTVIRRARLRGVESLGMLCAEDELGLSDRHAGLLDLPADAVPGTPLAGVLGPPETVLELEITPNRPDCLSVMGVAREVAAMYGVPLRRPEVALREGGAPAAELATVDVRDTVRCPRYIARVVCGVHVAPSPAWMQRRLSLAGLRPINNLVDVTNFVLLECGHPLHAFDYDRLADRRIVVRTAEAGERMTTLDGTERELDPETLLIADADRPVAIAGVMGGAGSEVGAGTQRILLESAYFLPAGIRRTSRRLGLTTESSYRFARGTDIEGAGWASRRAAALVAELAGGEVAPDAIDVYPAPREPGEVACRWAAVERLVGAPPVPGEAEALFERLGLEVVARDAEGCRVRIPSHRGDLRLEVDLVEEYTRLLGLDRLPERAPRAAVVPGASDQRAWRRHDARRHLAALGLHEVMNYSLTSPALLDRFDAAGAANRIVLPNPLSEAQSVLRDRLLPQLVETLGRNRSRQIEEAALFELGRVFRLDGGRTAESTHVAVALMGPAGRARLRTRPAPGAQEMFGWIRGVVEAWAAKEGARLEGAPEDHPAMQPGRALRLSAGGRPLGRAGLLREDLAASWRIYGPVGVAEVCLDGLLDAAAPRRGARPPAVYPGATRDAAFLVDNTVTHEDILEVLRRAAPTELESVSLFDMYEGKGIPAGRKSMAYSLVYRAADRTLTDDEVNGYHDAMTRAAKAELGAELRDA